MSLARTVGLEPTTSWFRTTCSTRLSYVLKNLVSAARFERATSRTRTERSSQTELREEEIGRDDRIRTCDHLLPKQALYQAELRPENRLCVEACDMWCASCDAKSGVADRI